MLNSQVRRADPGRAEVRISSNPTRDPRVTFRNISYHQWTIRHFGRPYFGGGWIGDP
jgi:hypothetical protein